MPPPPNMPPAPPPPCFMPSRSPPSEPLAFAPPGAGRVQPVGDAFQDVHGDDDPAVEDLADLGLGLLGPLGQGALGPAGVEEQPEHGRYVAAGAGVPAGAVLEDVFRVGAGPVCHQHRPSGSSGWRCGCGGMGLVGVWLG